MNGFRIFVATAAVATLVGGAGMSPSSAGWLGAAHDGTQQRQASPFESVRLLEPHSHRQAHATDAAAAPTAAFAMPVPVPVVQSQAAHRP